MLSPKVEDNKQQIFVMISVLSRPVNKLILTLFAFSTVFFYYSTYIKLSYIILSIFLFVLLLLNYLRSHKIQTDCFYVVLAVIFSVIYGSMFFSEILSAIISWRFFWGIFVVILLLRNFYNIPPEKITYLLLAVIFVEKIAIFTNPDLIEIMGNYEPSFTVDMAKFPLGVSAFGGNRTNTSVIFAALSIYYYIRGNQNLKWLCLLSSILAFSTTGLLLSAVFLSLYIKSWIRNSVRFGKYAPSNYIAIFCAAFIFGALVIHAYFIEKLGNIFDRFSLQYVYLILTYKLNLILSFFYDSTILDLLFGVGSSGMQVQENYSLTGNNLGDFILLDFIYRYGFFGLSLFLFIILFLCKSKSAFYFVLVMFLGSAHYYPLFSVIGQFITALIITRDSRDNLV